MRRWKLLSNTNSKFRLKMRRFLLTSWAVICCLVAWAVDYEVVPLPQRVENQKGAPFVLNAEVRIVAPEGLRREAAFLHDYLQELTGLDLSLISRRDKKARCIVLSVSPKVSEKEGYLMTVSQRSITIEGGSAASPSEEALQLVYSMVSRHSVSQSGEELFKNCQLLRLPMPLVFPGVVCILTVPVISFLCRL